MKKKVWENKCNKQKLVTIPKDCDILPGDYVWVEKCNNEVIKERK